MTEQTEQPSALALGDPGAPWWRHAVVYQVYIRSFADGNGDGIGDIAGLRSRLGYIRDLGADAIWVNPWYVSPLNDGGYDVADYREIDPRIGTLAEARGLVEDAHGLGLRVLADLVPNHTSSEHRWFEEALAADPGAPARERFHFRPGRGAEGAEPPNNWHSVFGGPAWTRVEDGEWYLHIFDPTQPDLNWEHPEVRAEFEDIIRFWLDLGFDGFRVDVAHALAKHMDLPDVDRPASLDWFPDHPYWDRDEVHEIIRSWRSVLDEYEGRMMVAESFATPERLPQYIRPDEYHQTFDFPFLQTGWDASAFRDVIESSIDAARSVDAVPTWVLGNHDVVRPTTRYGLPEGVDASRWLLDGPHDDLDAELGLRRWRAAVLMMLALPGAAYLYQGEELGLPEVWDLPDSVLHDPIWERSGRTEKGRDGCRVPMPWTPDGPSFGFGSNGTWLPQPVTFGALSVASQEGIPGSTLEMVRTALDLRRRHGKADETAELVDLGEDVVAFRRPAGLSCVVNMGSRPVDLPGATVLLASADVAGGVLQPDDAVWMLEE